MLELKDIYENSVAMLPKISLGILIFILFVLFSFLLKKGITKRVKPKTKNPLLAEFLGKLTAFIILIFGFVIFLNIVGLGKFASHIVAGAGLTTFILGFAFKDIGENFLSGILMAFKSPFKIGDLIETGGITGYVYELDLRTTSIKTFDGQDIFIPNSQLIKAPMSNYTIDGFLRYEIVLGIDYNSDIKLAVEKINSILNEKPEVLGGDKKPVIIIDQLLTSSVSIRILYWINTLKSKSGDFHLNLKSQITLEILEELTKLGIYMPADIVELKNYNNQQLNTNSTN